MAKPTTKPHKVCMVGEAKSGKSAVLRRWVRDDFDEDLEYWPTVSPEFNSKFVEFEEMTLLMQIWDMGFAEEETPLFFKGFVSHASGILLMYDSTDEKALDNLTYWLTEVSNYSQANTPIVVVSCKAELAPAPGVFAQVMEFCESYGFQHVETSARTGMGIPDCYHRIADQIYEGLKAPTCEADAPRRGPRHPHDAVEEEPGEPVYQKIVLLGKDAVGKSAMMQRFGHGMEAEVPKDYWRTPGPELFTRVLSINRKPYRLQLWDVAGTMLQEVPELCGPYMYTSDGAVIMYDITNRDSFLSLGYLLDVLKEWATESMVAILLGNKLDLAATRRQVAYDEGRALAEVLGIPFMEVTMLGGLERIWSNAFRDGKFVKLNWLKGTRVEAVLKNHIQVDSDPPMDSALKNSPPKVSTSASATATSAPTPAFTAYAVNKASTPPPSSASPWRSSAHRKSSPKVHPNPTHRLNWGNGIANRSPEGGAPKDARDVSPNAQASKSLPVSRVTQQGKNGAGYPSSSAEIQPPQLHRQPPTQLLEQQPPQSQPQPLLHPRPQGRAWQNLGQQQQEQQTQQQQQQQQQHSHNETPAMPPAKPGVRRSSSPAAQKPQEPQKADPLPMRGRVAAERGVSLSAAGAVDLVRPGPRTSSVNQASRPTHDLDTTGNSKASRPTHDLDTTGNSKASGLPQDVDNTASSKDSRRFYVARSVRPALHRPSPERQYEAHNDRVYQAHLSLTGSSRSVSELSPPAFGTTDTVSSAACAHLTRCGPPGSLLLARGPAGSSTSVDQPAPALLTSAPAVGQLTPPAKAIGVRDQPSLRAPDEIQQPRARVRASTPPACAAPTSHSRATLAQQSKPPASMQAQTTPLGVGGPRMLSPSRPHRHSSPQAVSSCLAANRTAAPAGAPFPSPPSRALPEAALPAGVAAFSQPAPAQPQVAQQVLNAQSISAPMQLQHPCQLPQHTRSPSAGQTVHHRFPMFRR